MKKTCTKKTKVSDKGEYISKKDQNAVIKRQVNELTNKIESNLGSVKFFFFKYNTPDQTPIITAATYKFSDKGGKEYLKIAFSFRNPKDKYNKNRGKLEALKKLAGCPDIPNTLMEYYGDSMAQTAMAFNNFAYKPSFLRGYRIKISIDQEKLSWFITTSA
jgi:hypothetical protein